MNQAFFQERILQKITKRTKSRGVCVGEASLLSGVPLVWVRGREWKRRISDSPPYFGGGTASREREPYGSGSFGEVAEAGFDGGGRREVFGAFGAEFGEFAGSGEDGGFEGADGGVVAFDGGFEAAADFLQVIGEVGGAIVEVAAEAGDFVGVFGDGFLAPAVGGGFEEGDERDRRGEENFAGDGAFEEGGVGLEGGGEEVIAGDEEDDELGGGLELLPVVFGAEGVDVAADFLGVVGESGGAGGFVGGVEGFAVGLDGGFGVDDDALAAGEADDEVGAEGAGGFLFGEVGVGKHVGEFDDAAELELAPAAGVAGGAEGGGELGGFGLEAELGGAEGFELLAELAVGGGARFFEFADLGIHFFERLFEGFDEEIDGLLAGGEVALGLLLKLGEGGFGEFEEGGVVALEGVGGEGFELGGEAGVGVGEGF